MCSNGQDGTRNVDVSVDFRPTHDSYLLKFKGDKDYLLDFLKSECGKDYIETSNIGDNSLIISILYIRVHNIHSFRILPKCCGKTELAGPGGIGGNSGYY